MGVCLKELWVCRVGEIDEVEVSLVASSVAVNSDVAGKHEASISPFKIWQQKVFDELRLGGIGDIKHNQPISVVGDEVVVLQGRDDGVKGDAVLSQTVWCCP